MNEEFDHSEESRQKLIELGRNNLFFFAQFMLGMNDLAEDPHLSLCRNLEGKGEWGTWSRAMVCAARGFLKSSICTIAWPLHQAIYKPNWACRILGASHDNIKQNFFRPMLRLFRESDQRNLLLWLYGDRIKGDFEGWTDDAIAFIRTDPLAQPSISYKGIESDQEGFHGDAIIIDDPEGADAEKSKTVNIDAERAVGAAVPLLKNPTTDKILVVLTPWGTNPLAYKLKENKAWKSWWMPILDEQGKATWPARFPEPVVNQLRLTTPKSIWDSQYLLKRPAEGTTLLPWAAIQAGMWKWKVPGQIIEYPALEADKAKLAKGEYDLRVVTRKIEVTQLRFYMHVDPVHKEDPISSKFTGTARPSKCAIVIVGIAPDFHAFVITYYTDRVGLDEQVKQVYRMYRQYAPFEVTFDPVGAQAWFRDYCLSKERSDLMYRAIESSGTLTPKRQLPALTARLIEDKRPVRVGKEVIVQERLEPWLAGCGLHIHEAQNELIEQLKGFPDATTYVDLVDALAQGPPRWKPGLTADQFRHSVSGNNALAMQRDAVTGYLRPWADPKQKSDK